MRQKRIKTMKWQCLICNRMISALIKIYFSYYYLKDLTTNHFFSFHSSPIGNILTDSVKGTFLANQQVAYVTRKRGVDTLNVVNMAAFTQIY